MIIEVNNLNKSFRHPWNLQWIPVLKDVSFSIEKTSIVGFLGANGAGKTTSIKCLLGLLSFQSGKINIFGEDHFSSNVRKKVGYLPERPFFYNYLTAEEFLKFYSQLSSSLRGKELDKRVDYLLDLVGLVHAKKVYLKQFSKGMLQRIGMAQALIHNPKLLILDEPLSGLDPDGRRQLASIIQDAYDSGVTVFFSSHLLDDVDRLCQKLVVISGGNVKFNGDKSEFVNRSDRSYIIQYQEKERVITEKIKTAGELQLRIDQLRSLDHQIVSVDLEKMSLDKAFDDFQKERTL